MRGAGGARRPPRFVEEILNIFVEETLLKIATSRLNRLSSKACLSPLCLISRILKQCKIRLSLELYSSRSLAQFVLLSFTWFIDRASW